VRNRYNLTFQEPQGKETPISLRFAHALSGQGKTTEDRSASTESMSLVLAQISARVVSSHVNMEYCIYGT